MDRTACTEPQCLYKGDFYLIFFLPGPKTLPLESVCSYVGCIVAESVILLHQSFRTVGLGAQYSQYDHL